MTKSVFSYKLQLLSDKLNLNLIKNRVNKYNKMKLHFSI